MGFAWGLGIPCTLSPGNCPVLHSPSRLFCFDSLQAEKLRQQKAMLEAGLGVGDIPQQPAAAAVGQQQQQQQESGGDQPAAKRARPSEPS